MNVLREGRTLMFFDTDSGVELTRIRCKNEDLAVEKYMALTRPDPWASVVQGLQSFENLGVNRDDTYLLVDWSHRTYRSAPADENRLLDLCVTTGDGPDGIPGRVTVYGKDGGVFNLRCETQVNLRLEPVRDLTS